MWRQLYGGAKGISMDKKEEYLGQCCFHRALDILLEAGSFRPGTGDEGMRYTIRLGGQGEVVGVDINLSDRQFGEFLASSADSDE